MQIKEPVTKERLHDSEWVIFIGPEEVPAPGDFQEHSSWSDSLRGSFSRCLD